MILFVCCPGAYFLSIRLALSACEDAAAERRRWMPDVLSFNLSTTLSLSSFHFALSSFGPSPPISMSALFATASTLVLDLVSTEEEAEAPPPCGCVQIQCYLDRLCVKFRYWQMVLCYPMPLSYWSSGALIFYSWSRLALDHHTLVRALWGLFCSLPRVSLSVIL